jgi:hypothetical protein
MLVELAAKRPVPAHRAFLSSESASEHNDYELEDRHCGGPLTSSRNGLSCLLWAGMFTTGGFWHDCDLA